MKKIGYIVICFLIIFFGAATWYLHGINAKNSARLNRQTFVVAAGESSEEISEHLEKAGLIKSKFLFDVYAWKTGFDDKLQAGEYEVPSNLSIVELVRMLTTVRNKTEKKLTFIEGWDLKDMAAYVDKVEFASQDDFMAMVTQKKAWWDDYDILADKPRNLDLEGYLFPDTYNVYSDADVDVIVQKMLGTMQKKLTPELRAEIKKQKKTIHEILTLASIIEKEVHGDADRKIVSGIFYNRLKINMGLQADSTVNYVTGKNEASSSYHDISIDNPYNTYKYAGLPPGPIASPSESAILAAIYPARTEYLYFLTTPDGKVIYSKTYEQHVIAKNKYLK